MRQATQTSDFGPVPFFGTTETIQYAYDVFNRRISETFSTGGVSTTQPSRSGGTPCLTTAWRRELFEFHATVG